MAVEDGESLETRGICCCRGAGSVIVVLPCRIRLKLVQIRDEPVLRRWLRGCGLE